VGKTYLLVMAPIFNGAPELMDVIPHLNGPITQLTTTLTQPLPIFPRGREIIRHKHIQAFLFLLLLFLFFFSFLSSSLFCYHQWLLLRRERGEEVVELFLVKEVLPLLVVRRRERQKTVVIVLTRVQGHRSLLGTYWVDPLLIHGIGVVRDFLRPSKPPTIAGGLGVVGYQGGLRSRCGLDSKFSRDPRPSDSEE
jgi:hypothetical protein